MLYGSSVLLAALKDQAAREPQGALAYFNSPEFVPRWVFAAASTVQSETRCSAEQAPP